MSQLVKKLANRSWLRRSWPYPHIVARDVFVPGFYGSVAAQWREIRSRGLSEVPRRDHLSRTMPNYDAYGMPLAPSATEPLSIFLSRDWRDLLCRLFDITPTPYVFAGLHHHTVGSKSGFVHNDLNPVWFPRVHGDEIQVPNNDACAYRTGVGSLPDSGKIQVVRAVAMIFFVGNDGWRRGDGGETGLYSSGQSKVLEPAARWPPLNNSLITFECTPRSFHSFVTNTRLPRSSVIMWIHRPLQEAIEKFGSEQLERWK